jgi:hypothetical protein
VADHVTPVVSLVTEAVNCAVWPVATAVDCGLTATLISNGSMGDGAMGNGASWPHPAAKTIRE